MSSTASAEATSVNLRLHPDPRHTAASPTTISSPALSTTAKPSCASAAAFAATAGAPPPSPSPPAHAPPPGRSRPEAGPAGSSKFQYIPEPVFLLLYFWNVASVFRDMRQRGMRLYGMSCRTTLFQTRWSNTSTLGYRKAFRPRHPLTAFSVPSANLFLPPSLLVFSAIAPTATLLGRAAKRGASRNRGSPQRRSSALSRRGFS